MLVIASAAPAEPLRLINDRLFIEVAVNGVPTEALLDSGAEASLIDPAFASRAHLPEGKPQQIRGSGGTASARIIEGVTIRALGIDLHPEAVVVTDLAGLSKRLIGHPTQAIVGRELFDATRLRIDLQTRTIDAVDKGVRSRGRELPLAAHAGIESVPVRVNGVAAQAEFDLGNGSDVLISRAMARRLRLKPTGEARGGGIGGGLVRDLVTLRVLELGGARFRNVRAAIDDQPNANDLNVGTRILRNFLITTDFASRAVWLEPLGRAN